MDIRIQNFMSKHYRAFNPLWKVYFPLRTGVVHQPLPENSVGQVFDEIYQSNYWGSEESVSGQGSTLRYTAPLRNSLPELFKKYGIKTFLDAPCGDFNWMRHVDLSGVNYIGGDIVADLVAKMEQKYGNEKRRFVPCDIVNGPIPPVDMWMCRDVLFHLRYEEILNVLKVAARSDVKYLLTTTYTYFKDNIDLERTGGFRVINLERPPFNLPKPLTRIDDFVVPAIPRYVALWSREQIAEAIRGN